MGTAWQAFPNPHSPDPKTHPTGSPRRYSPGRDKEVLLETISEEKEGNVTCDKGLESSRADQPDTLNIHEEIQPDANNPTSEQVSSKKQGPIFPDLEQSDIPQLATPTTLKDVDDDGQEEGVHLRRGGSSDSGERLSNNSGRPPNKHTRDLPPPWGKSRKECWICVCPPLPPYPPLTNKYAVPMQRRHTKQIPKQKM
jgi:hypothetical protein